MATEKQTNPYSLQSTIQAVNNNFALIVMILVALALGFAGGSIWTENRMLKNGTGIQAAAPAQPAAPGAPQPNAKATSEFGHFPVKGDKNAKVGIVEYADMRCPFCKQFFDTANAQIMSDYVDKGKVKFAFRQFEFLGPASDLAGNAIECANDQGKFWEFHDYLYKNQPSESDTSLFTSDKLTPIAVTLGLNGPKFKDCVDTAKFVQKMNDDKAAGTTAGVSGTPSFVVGKITSDGKVDGELIVGAVPYETIKAAIDKALQ